jgi:hypothetical protein
MGQKQDIDIYNYNYGNTFHSNKGMHHHMMNLVLSYRYRLFIMNSNLNEKLFEIKYIPQEFPFQKLAYEH